MKQKNKSIRITHKNEEMLPKEKIPLVVIYKQNGEIFTNFGPDVQMFEVYGYLRCLIDQLGYDLTGGFENGDEEDD